MKKIQVGTTLTARSACDHECIFTAEVLKRTAKTVTVKTMEGVKRCKIQISYDGKNEFVYALGRYSMCPIFRAV